MSKQMFENPSINLWGEELHFRLMESEEILRNHFVQLMLFVKSFWPEPRFQLHNGLSYLLTWRCESWPWLSEKCLSTSKFKILCWGGGQLVKSDSWRQWLCDDLLWTLKGWVRLTFEKQWSWQNMKPAFPHITSVFTAIMVDFWLLDYGFLYINYNETVMTLINCELVPIVSLPKCLRKHSKLPKASCCSLYSNCFF